MEQPDVHWGSSLYYGLVKYMKKHASEEERVHFLKKTFPTIIDLALKVERLLPTEGIVISEQQKGKKSDFVSSCACVGLYLGFK